MNLRELKKILFVMNITDLKITEKKWKKIKERILFLSEPFFKKEKKNPFEVIIPKNFWDTILREECEKNEETTKKI